MPQRLIFLAVAMTSPAAIDRIAAYPDSNRRSGARPPCGPAIPELPRGGAWARRITSKKEIATEPGGIDKLLPYWPMHRALTSPR